MKPQFASYGQPMTVPLDCGQLSTAGVDYLIVAECLCLIITMPAQHIHEAARRAAKSSMVGETNEGITRCAMSSTSKTSRNNA